MTDTIKQYVDMFVKTVIFNQRKKWNLLTYFNYLFTFPKYSFEASGLGLIVGESGCQLAGHTAMKKMFFIVFVENNLGMNLKLFKSEMYLPRGYQHIGMLSLDVILHLHFSQQVNHLQLSDEGFPVKKINK